jgi:hypothetical protein
MSFLRNLFGGKRKSNTAQEILTKLMGLVLGASAPEITAYLRNKRTSDIVTAINGCDDLEEENKASLVNPKVITNMREALVQEVKRRGETRLLHN